MDRSRKDRFDNDDLYELLMVSQQNSVCFTHDLCCGNVKTVVYLKKYINML